MQGFVKPGGQLLEAVNALRTLACAKRSIYRPKLGDCCPFLSQYGVLTFLLDGKHRHVTSPVRISQEFPEYRPTSEVHRNEGLSKPAKRGYGLDVSMQGLQLLPFQR